MIFDKIENVHLYSGIHHDFAAGFEFLKKVNPANFAVGQYQISARGSYADVTEVAGRNIGAALFEAHDKFIDIHYQIQGNESLGWSDRVLLGAPVEEYPEKDLYFYSGFPEVILPSTSGYFSIFFPEDAHMPAISDGIIKKVVLKIKI